MSAVAGAVDAGWEAALPVLMEYVRIPNKSPHFDPEWKAHGHMDRAVELFKAWAEANAPEGATIELHELPGLTPVLLIDIPPTDPAIEGTVLLYGHLDKQPEMVGWREGLSPWEPVVEDGKLYGRGAGDDGYALFAALTAINAVRSTGGAHGHCLVLIEASEESGSPDLPAHLDALADRLASVDLAICLDSGAATYDRLWVTTSLRGLVSIDLRVDVVAEGLHSGVSGLVPSSFRILRQLLDRIEDSATGHVLVPECQAEIPAERREQAAVAAGVLGSKIIDQYPLVGSTQPTTRDPAEAMLAKTWSAAISTIGVDGIPPLNEGGNVLRPHTAVKLSLRLPPTADPEAAATAILELLTTDPPMGATVTASAPEKAAGWNATATAPWLAAALESASQEHFGQPAAAMGEGGTIPFLAMLGDRLPDAQFLVTGVLGPGSNAHGPNEFIDLAYVRGITACVASVLQSHAAR